MKSLLTCALTFFSTLCFGSGPYAPESVTDSGGTHIATYRYNEAGHRLRDGHGQNLAIGLLGKVVSLTQNGKTQITHHGLGKKRYLRTHSGGSKTIYLAGGSTEYRIPADNSATPEYVYHISGGTYSPVVQVRKKESSNPDYGFYIKDHLGSPLVIVDPEGNRIEKHHYGPWGQSVDARGVSVDPSTEHKGFTGHEMLNRTLIDMNARLYDASNGGFLAPDPVIEAPASLPNLNRYSYVNNSAPNWTDPTGLSRFTSTGQIGRWLFGGGPSRTLMEAAATDWYADIVNQFRVHTAKAGERVEDHFKVFNINNPATLEARQVAALQKAMRSDGAAIILTGDNAFNDLASHTKYLEKLSQHLELPFPVEQSTTRGTHVKVAEGNTTYVRPSENKNLIPHQDEVYYSFLTNREGPGTLLAINVTPQQYEAIKAYHLYSDPSQGNIGLINQLEFTELRPGQSVIFTGSMIRDSQLKLLPNSESIPIFIHASPATSAKRDAFINFLVHGKGW